MNVYKLGPYKKAQGDLQTSDPLASLAQEIKDAGISLTEE